MGLNVEILMEGNDRNIGKHIYVALQMLKHGRAGVPMEVMGLMLGEFVDDYTVRVIDVFAMPQSGTVSFFPTTILVKIGTILKFQKQVSTRKHSSRIRTARLPIVWGGGVSVQ